MNILCQSHVQVPRAHRIPVGACLWLQYFIPSQSPQNWNFDDFAATVTPRDEIEHFSQYVWSKSMDGERSVWVVLTGFRLGHHSQRHVLGRFSNISSTTISNAYFIHDIAVQLYLRSVRLILKIYLIVVCVYRQ